MSTFHLQIVTPDRMAYDGQAERVILRTVNGDVAILARHIDYAAPLGIGEARVTDENGNTRVGVCRVLATTFEWVEDIDRERAVRAQHEAEERLKELKRGDEQFAIAEAKLKRAIARLRATD